MHVSNILHCESNRYTHTILPRSRDKPLEFQGRLIYENKHQINKYLAIYETALSVIVTRYVLYNIHSCGSFYKEYKVYTFDDNYDCMKFIEDSSEQVQLGEIEFIFTADHLFQISVLLGCCEMEKLI